MFNSEVQLKIFISYSHKDEWLKEELQAILKVLERSTDAIVWHDRMILPGRNIDDEIDENLDDSDIFLMLISTDFMASNYCYLKEFERAKERHERGEMEIVPIIVRHCNWENSPIRDFNALPLDGAPVNGEGFPREKPETRDRAWMHVSKGLENLISSVENRTTPILKQAYINEKVAELSFVHPSGSNTNFDDLFVEPRIRTIENSIGFRDLQQFCQTVELGGTFVLSGENQSGKTGTLFKMQRLFTDMGIQTLFVSASKIRNANVEALWKREAQLQFENEVIPAKTILLMDDIDDIKLPESIKAKILEKTVSQFKGVVGTTFNSLDASGFSFGNDEGPTICELDPLLPRSVYELVSLWVANGGRQEELSEEQDALTKYRKVISVANDGSTRLYPSVVLMILQVISSTQDNDTAPTSNAAYYDAVLTAKIRDCGFGPNDVEQAKLFLGMAAFKNDQQDGNREVTADELLNIAIELDKKYISNLHEKFDRLLDSDVFIATENNAYRFATENLYFFVIGRYLGQTLKYDDGALYESILDKKIKSIHLRSSANILLYVVFFDREVQTLTKIVQALDACFSEVQKWKIGADEEKFIDAPDPFRTSITRFGDIDGDTVKSECDKLLLPGQCTDSPEEHINSFIGPFFDPVNTGVDAANEADIVFFQSMNSLFRLQSIAATALSVRAGTIPREKVVETVDSIIQAAGRFCHVNFQIAREIYKHSEAAIGLMRAEADRMIDSEIRRDSEKYERSTRSIVADRLLYATDYHRRWCVVISHGFVGRILSEFTPSRALRQLSDEELKGDDSRMNFSVTSAVSDTWRESHIDKSRLSDLIARFGENSAFVRVLRFCLFSYTKYLPIDDGEVEFLSSKFGISPKSLKANQFLLGYSKSSKGG